MWPAEERKLLVYRPEWTGRRTGRQDGDRGRNSLWLCLTAPTPNESTGPEPTRHAMPQLAAAPRGASVPNREYYSMYCRPTDRTAPISVPKSFRRRGQPTGRPAPLVDVPIHPFKICKDPPPPSPSRPLWQMKARMKARIRSFHAPPPSPFSAPPFSFQPQHSRE